MDKSLISHTKILQVCNDCGFSNKKVEKLREAGLFPKTVSRVGLGRGKGVKWLYDPSAIDQIQSLEQLTKQYRSYDEVRWRLWGLGYDECWEKVKEKLIESFPQFPKKIFPIDVDEFDYELQNIIRKRFSRFNPFDKNNEMIFTSVYWFMYPFLSANTYIERDDYQEIITSQTFGNDVIDFQKSLEQGQSFDPWKWKQSLSNCDETIGKKLSEVFTVLDEDLEKPENKKLYRLLRSRLGKTLVLWKVRSVLAGILAMMLDTIRQAEMKGEENNS